MVMKDLEMSVAEAKMRFSELVNRVAYAGEKIVITKRGRPVAQLSALAEKGLGSVKGWLDDDDPYFKEVREIEKRRHSGTLRAAKTRGRR